MELLSENLKRIIDGLDKGFYYVDKQRKVKFWSKKAEIITGFKAEEVIECKRLLLHESETGKVLCDENCPLEDSMLTCSIIERRVFLKQKEGQVIPVHVKVVPIYDKQGGAIGAVEIFDKID